MSSMRLVVAVACIAAACGRGRRPKTGGTGTEEAQLLAKVRGYLKCLQEHSSSVFLIEDTYREQLAHAAAPAGEDVRLAPSPDPKGCIDAIAAAKALPPRMPELERSGDDFAAALASVHELTDAAHAFDDRPKLLAAFDSFDRAQAALFDQVFRINRDVHLAQLSRREAKSGTSLGLLAEKAQLDAEALVPYGAESSDHVDATDVAGLEAHLATFEASIETMSSYAASHPDEVETFGDLTSFIEAARTFATSARELAERARNHIAYSDSEKLLIGAGDEAGVPGSPAAVVRAYNRFVQMR